MVHNMSGQVGGGADLASKAQILAYYELVLADLKVPLFNFNIASISIIIMGNPQVHRLKYISKA